MKGKYI